MCYNLFMSSKRTNINPTTLLSDFGLNEKESTVYLACLALGQTGVTQIGQESGVQRTYVYGVLGKLIDKGLVSEIETKGVSRYSAVEPDNFYTSQLEKIKRFESALPIFHTIQKRSKTRPKVQFFEGEKGIISAMNDSLRIPKGSEILSYSSGEGINMPSNEFQIEYIKRRIEQNISVRAIAPDTQNTRFYTDKDPQQLRQTRLVAPELFPFTNEINIYRNKVAIISLEDELVAVVIESESIANGQKAIFELAWKGAEIKEYGEEIENS